MRLGTAIEKLVDNYRYASDKEWIQDKVAWALYHTWKEADERKAEQTEPNCSEIPNNCKKCKWWNESYGCHWKEGVCHYVPKAIIPKQCVSCDSASRIIEAYSQGFKDGADAVKAMPQTFTADGIVFAKMDEPQTDCSWK